MKTTNTEVTNRKATTQKCVIKCNLEKKSICKILFC